MATGALTIKLKCTSWQQLATLYKRDLSRGSMFLKAASPPPLGTTVRIDLTLPSASVIVLTGAVEQYVTDPQRGDGVELRLDPIPASSVWMIESALAAEASRRVATPPGMPRLDVAPSGPTGAIGEGEGHDLSTAEADLVRALVAEAESLKKLNPFLVLGVGYEASDADVRSAFGELTKRYHPDRFARYDSTQLRQVAAEIFILIRDAYRRLGDDNARAQVLASLGRHSAAPRAVLPTGRVGTPPMGFPRVGGRPAAAHVPPLAKPSAPSTPSAHVASDPRRSAAAPASALNEATTKKPEPLPLPSAGNDDTTKRPQPLQARAVPERPSPPPAQLERRPSGSPSPVPAEQTDHGGAEELLDAGRLDEALAAYRALSKKHPTDRTLRAGIELCEGLAALAQRDRLEAAQRFESALEIDPSNERAARELAEMRRQATNERKGLLSRLMGKKEP